MVRAEKTSTARPASAVYTELTTLFSRFDSWQTGQERGGCPLPGDTYLNKSHPGGIVVYPRPGYHREQSFTRQEIRWIHEVTARLTGIAKGNFLPDVKEVQMEQSTEITQPRSLAERFSERALSGALKMQTVYEVLRDTAFEDVVIFAKRYPYLLPALDAMFKVAGIEGIKTALSQSHVAVSHIFFAEAAGAEHEGVNETIFKIDHGHKRQRLLARLESARRVRRALGGISGLAHFFAILIHSNSFEVACLGQNYARQLEEQFARGIRLLGQNGTIDKSDEDRPLLILNNGTIISPENLAPTDREIRPQMELLVARLRAQAEASFQQSLTP